MPNSPSYDQAADLELRQTAPDEHARTFLREITPTPATTKDMLNLIIESLREELEQHGETLILLEQHEMLVTNRRFFGLLESATAVNRPIAAIRGLRGKREADRRDLARCLNLDEDAKLTAMIPLLPTEYRALIEALIQENSELSKRVNLRVSSMPWCPPAWTAGAAID